MHNVHTLPLLLKMHSDCSFCAAALEELVDYGAEPAAEEAALAVATADIPDTAARERCDFVSAYGSVSSRTCHVT